MFKNVLFAVIVIAAFLSVTAAVLPIQSAQSQTGTTGSDTNGSTAIPDEMLFTDGSIGPVGIVNELREAHSVLTDIIIDHSNLNYGRAENIVFTMTVVDEEEEKLNVILNPILLTLGLAYNESDIADFVEIDEAMIDVRYGIFVPDSHIPPSSQSNIDRWMLLYESRCDSATASRLCEALAFNLGTQNHYVLNSNNDWQAPGTTPIPALNQTTEPEPAPKPVSTPSALPTTIFTDDFESDTSADWTIQGRYNWEIGSFDEGDDPPAHDNTNRVASADGCRAQCTLTLTTPLNMSSENRTALSFYRYVDQSLDRGEYLRVEVTDTDGTWTQIAEWSDDSGDDDQWHYERLDITQYISDSFQVRFVAKMSSSSEDVAIDDVIISRVFEFYGGNNYTMFFVEQNKPYASNGTITIGVTNSISGIKGIATSGHVVKLDNDTQRFQAHTVGNDKIVFNRNPDGYYHDIGNTDAAFVPIEDPNIIISNKVQALNGTILNVTHGNLSDISRWSTVNIYGALNNDDGWLYYKNATIGYLMNPVLINMGIANYDGNNGDSGAPIIYHNTSGTHVLVGLHVGGVCIFSSPSEFTSRTINVNGTEWCDRKNDNHWYKAFSAWENVKQVLDLQ